MYRVESKMVNRILLLAFLSTSLALIIMLVNNGFAYLRMGQMAPYQRHDVTSSTNRIHHSSCHKRINSPEEWIPPLTPKTLQNISQYDLALIKHICEEWLLPPFTGERRLDRPEREDYSQREQSQYIDELLEGKTNGFFVESGVGNGEGLSNSLFFEKSRNWTGLLVEANPDSFRSVLRKRRHSYMVNACLSPCTKSVVLRFRLANLIGGLVDQMEDTHKARIQHKYPDSASTVSIQCFPLYSILKAMNVTYIDYFSLDIEGAELEVLYTIPFDQITIDVFSIEYAVSSNSSATADKLADIKRYLVTSHGYKLLPYHKGEDVILKKV